MRTCCCCGTHWKESQKENKIVPSKHSLIYGCRKCQKGHGMHTNRKEYYQFGEWENKEGED